MSVLFCFLWIGAFDQVLKRKEQTSLNQCLKNEEQRDVLTGAGHVVSRRTCFGQERD